MNTQYPRRSQIVLYPSRPSGVLSQVLPVWAPPCHITSGYFRGRIGFWNDT
jgi:hypothetical protein